MVLRDKNKRMFPYPSEVVGISEQRLDVGNNPNQMLLLPLDYSLRLRIFQVEVHCVVHNLVLEWDVQQVRHAQHPKIVLERDLPLFVDVALG